jgi:hypothetical protein
VVASLAAVGGVVGLAIAVAWWALVRAPALDGSRISLIVDGRGTVEISTAAGTLDLFVARCRQIGGESAPELMGDVQRRSTGSLPGGRGPDAVAAVDRVSFAGMKPGVPYEVALTDRVGRTAWSRTVKCPRTEDVHLACDGRSPGALVVSVPSGGATTAELVLLSGGERWWFPASGHRDARLLIVATLPFDRLGEKGVIEVTMGDGLIHRYPLLPVTALAAGLAGKLERFRPESVIRPIVGDKDRFSPLYDYPRSYSLFAERAEFAMAARYASRRRRVKDGYFLGLIREALVSQGLWADLELFRPYADRFFGGNGFPLEARLDLYEGLLKLQYLDLVCACQLDPPGLNVRELYRGLVSTEWELEGARIGRRDPDRALAVLGQPDRPLAWVTSDYGEWGQLAIWLRSDPGLIPNLLPGVENPAAKDLPALFKTERQVDVEAVGSARGQTATVRALVAMMGPAFFLEIGLPCTVGRHEEVSLLLTHPASDGWYQTMDELGTDGSFFGEEVDPATCQRRFGWGQIRTVFPAQLLPVGPFRMRVGLRHVPGVVALKDLCHVPRTAHTRLVELTATGQKK